MPGLPNRRCELAANDLFFLTSPETGHQQNTPAQTRNSQRHSLICRSNAEPLRPFGFERHGARSRAMPVGIGFNHGTRNDVRTDMLLYLAKVFA
jgi:hypothetical protein